MQHIVVIGKSGSGKSTLARALSNRVSLPITHLDPLYYLTDWRPGDPDAFRAKVSHAAAQEEWIIDGMFLSLIGDIVLSRAQLILWLEQPAWVCLFRAAWRAMRPWGGNRADLPAGCRDNLDRDMLHGIRTFDRRERVNIQGHLDRLAPNTPRAYLAGDKGVRDFLVD